MKKPTNSGPEKYKGRGPLSKKVISYFAEENNDDVIALFQHQEEVEDDTESLENISKIGDTNKFDDFEVSIRRYVQAQEQLSLLIEYISLFPVLDKLNLELQKAQDKYSPSGPPESPIVALNFVCWAFYDLCLDLKYKETLSTVALDMCINLDPAGWVIPVFQKLQSSRMGVYVQEGKAGNFVVLRELITNIKINAISPIGYMGNIGEIWFVRILPAYREEYLNPVIFTPPYILGKVEKNKKFSHSVEDDWVSFFVRTLSKTGIKDNIKAYEHLMKYGLSTDYWFEYISRSFHSDQGDHLFLAGVPDVQ
jgi:hypothetical protein